MSHNEYSEKDKGDYMTKRNYTIWKRKTELEKALEYDRKLQKNGIIKDIRTYNKMLNEYAMIRDFWNFDEMIYELGAHK